MLEPGGKDGWNVCRFELDGRAHEERFWVDDPEGCKGENSNDVDDGFCYDKVPGTRMGTGVAHTPASTKALSGTLDFLCECEAQNEALGSFFVLPRSTC